MNTKTLKALEGSISKWRAIVEGTGTDEGVDNCPLCILFNKPGSGCAGCPVKEETGVAHCAESPYDAWDRGNVENEAAGLSFRANTPELKDLAAAELQFLESLRPDLRTVNPDANK